MIYRIVPLGLVLFGSTSLGSPDEASLLQAVDVSELKRHARAIVQHRRDGGSPGEHAAVDYVVETLRADGIPVEVHEFRAYVSDPGECRLRIDGAEPRAPECRTQALAAATPPGGVGGEIVFVGEGAPEDYAGADVEGKIVLVDALPMPGGVRAAELAGAAGAIFTATDTLIQELTVSPVWGTPTHENYDELPEIPSVNVSRPTAEALREAIDAGTVTALIETEVDTGWKTLRLPVATVESEKDPEGYVLVGGHIDGWHYAAVDEGASNAAMVEMARIVHRHRDELERSLKVAWWPAHSNGRYAGSAWYVDHAWMDLRENALAYMNIDGVGQIGATAYRSSNTASMDALAGSVLRDVAGVDAGSSRPGRNSDQGFYGIGLPLLQFNHFREDPGGRYWFWHTTEDTFDKIDFGVLAGDTRLYLAALHRLLTEPIPPLRLSAATDELEQRLERWQRRAEGHLDLSRAVQLASELGERARELDRKLESASPSSPSSTAEIVRGMVRVLRPVLRVTYQERGPYHQDPALDVPKLPGLAPLESLDGLPRESDLYGFTRTYLVRERNRLEDHLRQAIEGAEALAARLDAEPGDG